MVFDASPRRCLHKGDWRAAHMYFRQQRIASRTRAGSCATGVRETFPYQAAIRERNGLFLAGQADVRHEYAKYDF